MLPGSGGSFLEAAGKTVISITCKARFDNPYVTLYQWSTVFHRTRDITCTILQYTYDLEKSINFDMTVEITHH